MPTRQNDALARLLATAQDECGPVDILVNNAATRCGSRWRRPRSQPRDRTFAVYVRAAACLCAAVLPGMRARRFGRIVNIGSEAGVAIVPGLAAYCVSKHALRARTEVIQDGNHDNGIKAWVVCPGFVETDMGYVVPGANPAQLPHGRGGGRRGPLSLARWRQRQTGHGDLAAHHAQSDGHLAGGDRHD
jgi:short-subunit dehydrogenase